MSEFYLCAYCNQQIKRAYLDDDKQYCIQCVPNHGQEDESQALMLIDYPIEDDNVEVICEIIAPY